MAYQYLKITPLILNLDISISLGFQRVASVLDGAQSETQAIEKTSSALEELFEGWGTKSSEWKDLIRVLTFYGFPIPSNASWETSKESQPGTSEMFKLARYICASTKRLVELLCALQAICLQRVSNALQQNLRHLVKDVSMWRDRCDALTNSSGLDKKELAQQTHLDLRYIQEKEARIKFEQQVTSTLNDLVESKQSYQQLKVQSQLEIANLEQLLEEEKEKVETLTKEKHNLELTLIEKEKEQEDGEILTDKEKILLNDKKNLLQEIVHLKSRLNEAEDMIFNQSVELSKYSRSKKLLPQRSIVELKALPSHEQNEQNEGQNESNEIEEIESNHRIEPLKLKSSLMRRFGKKQSKETIKQKKSKETLKQTKESIILLEIKELLNPRANKEPKSKESKELKLKKSKQSIQNEGNELQRNSMEITTSDIETFIENNPSVSTDSEFMHYLRLLMDENADTKTLTMDSPARIQSQSIQLRYSFEESEPILKSKNSMGHLIERAKSIKELLFPSQLYNGMLKNPNEKSKNVHFDDKVSKKSWWKRFN